jgi:hypothetical protein
MLTRCSPGCHGQPTDLCSQHQAAAVSHHHRSAHLPVRCRRTGSDSCVTLQNLPWSPRWPVDEQVARLFNFLKLHAAKASVVDTATAAGGGGVAATSGGAGSASGFPAAAPLAVGDAAQEGAAGASSLPPGFNK